MSKPFLILQARPEDFVADQEYEAMLKRGRLDESRVHRIRLDKERMPDGLNLDDYAGVIIGGGPGCVSDDPDTRPEIEARIERDMLDLMPAITARDFPFLGCCLGMSILAHHLGAEVSKRRYSESVGPVDCTLTEAGREDPLTGPMPQEFTALVGHKEAVQELPPGAVHLVASGPCPYQMIRHGQNVYAAQFHPEADGDVFAGRVDFYLHRGYFDPSEGDRIKEVCYAAEATEPPGVLERFVARYG